MEQGRSLKKAKAERVAKKKRALRRKRTIFLLVEILVLCFLLCTGYVITKYGKLQFNFLGKDDLIRNEGVREDEYTTIALFGGDSREGKLGAGTHSDAIMLLSIHDQTKEIRMVSVYRDLLTQQMNGEFKKANQAYFTGGAQEAINMLNRNFDLDIDGYLTVDFRALAKAIDLLGGIEAEVTEAEAKEMNNYLQESASVVKAKATYVAPGKQTLDGVKALTYVRIRKNVGEDYGRTKRQRVVVQQIFEKLKDMKLTKADSMINEVFTGISTNFTLKELLDLFANAVKYDLKDQGGFAFEYGDCKLEGAGSVIAPVGLVENVQELHHFLYPKSTYQVTETVREIAKEIENLTGYKREPDKAQE